MPRAHELRKADVLQALGAKAHELRAWLQLEPLASRSTRARSPTRYTPVDLLFLSVVQTLDGAGLKLQALQSFSKALYKQLQQPTGAGSDGKNDVLEVHQGSGTNWKLGPAPAGA